jgi:hypothetical protein
LLFGNRTVEEEHAALSRALAPDIERQDVEPLLRSIFSVADELDVREDREKGFEFANNTLRIHWLMNTILEKWTIEERSELLRKAAPAAQLGWLLDLANRCERPYKKEASADDQKEPLVSQSVAAEIRNLAHTRLREAAAAQQILLNPRARNLIWLLANLEPDGPKLVKRVTNRALKTAEGTAALADALTTISWSQTLGMFGPGDRVARGTPRVQRDGLDKMVDQKKLHAQVQRFTSDPATTPADRLKLERFLTGWQTSNDD